ncbi:unnamed protein product [Rangifer tarandus platyrhynchus]|uniref:Uncharacterized protein n=2 Tax=Rangifer tarandus platyrhynchus TaxID=3082113 RepID=A0ACB0F7V1_RANTA|nr:unnamed protein product [Rangifer tarandus platyrhynchus]CAI9709172.1 unnamed protein product [Rangifer tarandus platyrhynchus]
MWPCRQRDCHLQDVPEAIPDELSLPAHNQADSRMTEALDQLSPAKTIQDQPRPAQISKTAQLAYSHQAKLNTLF